MAAPLLTYTLTNGTTADASQVMQNFTDLLNGMTDGTKDLTFAGLTVTGNAAFQGNVTLGNGSVDDITVTGSLASTIPIKTNNSFDIGSSTLGLASLYLGAPSSRTVRLRANQSIASSFTLILPLTVGSAGEYIEGDGTGGLSFVPVRRSPNVVSNYSLSGSVSSNQLTVTIAGADGNAISSSNPVHVVSRNATQTTGTPTVNTLTSAPTSVVVPNGATLGHVSGQTQYVYVYVIFGTATEIAVSGQPVFDENSLQNATAITAGSTSGSVLYATSNHTSKPIRYLGRLKSSQTVAGTWASTMNEISLAHAAMKAVRSELRLSGYAGKRTLAIYTTRTDFNRGTAFTWSGDTGSDAYVTINEDGLYSFSMRLQNSTSAPALWIDVDVAAGSTPSLESTSLLVYVDGTNSATFHHVVTTPVVFLQTGVKVRFKINTGGTPADLALYATKVAD